MHSNEILHLECSSLLAIFLSKAGLQAAKSQLSVGKSGNAHNTRRRISGWRQNKFARGCERRSSCGKKLLDAGTGARRRRRGAGGMQAGSRGNHHSSHCHPERFEHCKLFGVKSDAGSEPDITPSLQQPAEQCGALKQKTWAAVAATAVYKSWQNVWIHSSLTHTHGSVVP